MKADYSAAVERALHRAAQHARGHGREEIAPADLLFGLLHDDEGLPFLHLVAAGAEADGLKRLLSPAVDLDQEATKENPPAVPDAQAPDAPATRQILRDARELSRVYAAEGAIGSEQLLLALVERDAECCRRLEAIGLDMDRLKARIAPEQPPLVMEETLDLGGEPGSAEVARILDASANRAREALRVLEDHCRFALDDALLAGLLKKLRHELTAALADLPADWLLGHRDTLHDVGTGLTTQGERERASPEAVLAANAKRLQEALRSLEEYGKMASPDLGAVFEKQRYQAYTIERALLLGREPRRLLRQANLYALVAESSCKLSLVGTVRELLDGGVQLIQLREKSAADRQLLERARELRKMTRQAGAIFIVNDRPDIALLSGADGVHLGQEDMPVHEARRVLGAKALIGVSTHNLDQVRRAVLEGASYLGVGPTFPSQTKDFETLAGLEFVQAACAETSLPAFILGGVTLDNVDQVLAAGGRRVALGHALCATDTPREAAAAFRRKLDPMAAS